MHIQDEVAAFVLLEATDLKMKFTRHICPDCLKAT